MIAKIVSHGPDRNSALQLLRQALADTQVRMCTRVGCVAGWVWVCWGGGVIGLDTFKGRHTGASMKACVGGLHSVKEECSDVWSRECAQGEVV